MYKIYRSILIAVLVLVAIAVGWYVSGQTIPMLEPGGAIAEREKILMIWVFGLMLIVAIPVFIMAGVIAYRYREGSNKGQYRPDYNSDRRAELTWWGIPIVLITILAVMTWVSTHKLDPYNALASKQETLKIQVVSLDWKWLFIYPKANVATVNYAQIPVDTPVKFRVTSDSVMNSFWVPGLGSQIYTMPGMYTEVNLIADEPREYYGSSANISGRGFADMHFIIKATGKASYQAWLDKVSASNKTLDLKTYAKLAKPSRHHPITYYGSVYDGLFDRIVMQYMMPHYMIKPFQQQPSSEGGSSEAGERNDKRAAARRTPYG